MDLAAITATHSRQAARREEGGLGRGENLEGKRNRGREGGIEGGKEGGREDGRLVMAQSKPYFCRMVKYCEVIGWKRGASDQSCFSNCTTNWAVSVTLSTRGLGAESVREADMVKYREEGGREGRRERGREKGREGEALPIPTPGQCSRLQTSSVRTSQPE